MLKKVMTLNENYVKIYEVLTIFGLEGEKVV